MFGYHPEAVIIESGNAAFGVVPPNRLGMPQLGELTLGDAVHEKLGIGEVDTVRQMGVLGLYHAVPPGL
ncbi:Uncharacterised protein [Mycobacteroides abscessus]|nr:Uncharacterised protein [Mycobacteroides abscessus]SLF03965.1 Uncharacterised protein [Mycobacteroides abscessus subsp. massiliense]